MNVVLILGNGFDRNLDMPTSYEEFAKYYYNLEKSDKWIQIFQDELRKIFGEKPQYNHRPEPIRTNAPVPITISGTFLGDNWVDLELFMGDFANTLEKFLPLPKDLAEAYKTVCADVRDELTKYLKEIDKREIPSNLRESFCKDICEIDKHIDGNGLAQKFATFSKPNEINLNVVTFNYTSFADRIFSEGKGIQHKGKVLHINKVLHPHGSVFSEGGIILGVNGYGQIHSNGIQRKEEIRALVEKPFLAQTAQHRDYFNSQNLINKAELIIIYGASLGNSDATWRTLIKDKEVSGSCVVLAYYNTDETSNDLVNRAQHSIRMKNNILETFQLDSIDKKNYYSISTDDFFKIR